MLAIPLRGMRLDLRLRKVPGESLNFPLFGRELELHRADYSRGQVRRPLLLVLLAAAGCGSEPPSAESVVRAWSASVNSGDNAAAARLFAHGATVVRDGKVRTLRSYNAARGWNAALRWCGRIVSVSENGATVRAVFLLRTRQRFGCTGPGERAHTLFRVRDGKIVLWHQLDQAPEPDEESA
jgi:hypothetical protein